jgi:beta-lactamase class A
LRDFLKARFCLLPAKGSYMFIYRLCLISLFSLTLFFSATHLYANDKSAPAKLQLDPALSADAKVEESIHKSNFSNIISSYAVVTAPALNLRSGPSTINPALKVLPKGTHLLSLSVQDKKWLKVRIPQGVQGWVAQEYVKFYLPEGLPYYAGKFNSTPFTSSLEASILQYMKEIYSSNRLKRNDKLSIVVQDLTNGEILVSLRSRQSVKSASTIKLPILHAYMIQRFKGKIKASSNHKKLIEEMIRFSSNSSTNTIIKLLGGTKNIQRILNNTKLYKELNLLETIPEDGRTYRNKISAADLNQLFVNIWFKRVIGVKYSPQINKAASKEMLYLLGLPGHVWLKDRIKAGTCFSANKLVKLWDKTGFVKGVNGNAGIVEIDTPHGRRAYSIVMFIEREDYQTITGDATSWSERVSLHMRKISELTFSFISNRYESYNDCGRSLLIRYTKLALAPRPLQASL